MFGNPVAQAVIRSPGSPFIFGDFRVTAAFGVIDKYHPTPHQGVDIGNGKCGDPVHAMADGLVSMVAVLGTAKALVFRIAHPQFDPDLESGYAHLATFGTNPRTKVRWKVGDRIYRGEQLGTLGTSGASACHLHIGMKRAGVEIDSWPLLDQNEVTDMLKGANPVVVSNRKGFVLGDNTRFRSAPVVLADNVLAEYDTEAEIAPDYIVDGTNALGTTKWYGAWGNTPKGKEFGYLNVNTVSALKPIEQSGHTDDELAAAAKKGAHAAAADVSGAASSAAAKYPA